MGKEKRKTRLNKGDAGEFIGFGAFATTPTAAGEVPEVKSPTTANVSNMKWTPIYSGADDTLQILFPRIGQKRDATTKSKALIDLKDFFCSGEKEKKTQIDALKHFFYLYYNKLYYDNNSRVRASCLECCQASYQRIPKAWKTLTGSGSSGSSSESSPPNYSEVLGMIICARADPAADVRLAANQFTTWEDCDDNNNNKTTATPNGVWAFARRILSYGKPMAMHQDLFQKSSSTSSSSNNATPTTTTTPTMSDRQSDELEERFERIVGTVLGGFNLYLQQHPEAATAVADEDTRWLWKTLSSPKHSLRRQTYQLLSTACQKTPSLVDQDKLSKILAQNLSSEKEPTNVSILLETLLAFLAYVPKGEERTNVMATHFTKPLGKLFQKGCHGATQWNMTVLPLVALLDPVEAQPHVLTCLWQGKSHLVGLADQLQIVTAVAETATFLLTQKPPQELSQVVAKCWFQALQTYLTMPTAEVKGAAKNTLAELRSTLVRDAKQFDQACDNNKNPTCAMVALQDWFWKEELPNVMLRSDVNQDHLALLLGDMSSSSTSSSNNDDDKSSSTTTTTTTPKYLTPILKSKINLLLDQCQQTASPPTLEEYPLWIVILERILATDLFENNNNNGVDHFVVNQLLQWMILHTSSISDQMDENLALLDFRIYQLCQPYVSSNNKDNVWDTLLRELVAAQCDLHLLVHGMTLLAKKMSPVMIRSTVLEELCIQVAKDAVARHMITAGDYNNDDGESSDATELRLDLHHKRADFLQFCVGLGEGGESLVGDAVVQSWLDAACPNDSLQLFLEFNPVLETLVFMVKNGDLQGADRSRVLVQAWRQGGSFWRDTLVPWLYEHPALLVELVALISKDSETVLRQSVAESKVLDEHLVQVWSERAYRLVALCQKSIGTTAADDNALAKPSLGLVGLADITMWKQNGTKSYQSFLAQCLMNLVRLVPKQSQRWELFSNNVTTELFVQILVSLSGGDTNLLKASFARSRRDGCAMLLAELGGGKNVDSDILHGWIRQTIATLASNLGEKGASSTIISRGIAVLSQLLELAYAPVRPAAVVADDSAQDKIDVEKIQEGDTLWYILKAEDTSVREKCTVVKVHIDVPNDVYFTIRVTKDGESQERQTVGERLRSAPAPAKATTANLEPGAEIAVDKVSKEDASKRQSLSDEIINQLIIPHWENSKSYQYELISIVVYQLGLFGERGIGSTRYLILQKLMRIQSTVVQLGEEMIAKKESAIEMLWQLSLALGYGCGSPPSYFTMPLMKFDPSTSITTIDSFYGDNEDYNCIELDCAASAWMTTSIPWLESKEKREQAFFLLLRLAAKLFASAGAEGSFTQNDFVALRALSAAQKESHKTKEGGSILQDAEAEALSEFIKAFASRWETEGDSTFAAESLEPTWWLLSFFEDVLASSLNHRPSLVAAASRGCADALVSSLFADHKCRYTMQILDKYAEAGIPIHAEPDDAMNEETESRLEAWCKNLIDEEAEELEADIEIAAQWIPKSMMNEIESWSEFGNAAPEDTNVIRGRMCCWLSFLNIVDVAASKDTLNRLALTSYASKCQGVDAILAMAVDYGNIGTEKKANFAQVAEADEILRNDSAIDDIPKLASLCLFRTVEVFPTLAKNWWEMVCPNYFTSVVRDFVETSVSPEILKRELARIQKANSFGEMKVKGSTVSREVTATYMQDEFTLSVVIRIPLSFPFRRAEVDCSKTLGVPEKRWKRWSLQITQMLNNQGGTLQDALMIWKENVDKEFEGVEPCPVCYSVLHVKTHKLPEMECKTCHNRFHFDCLTQWFRSSGKSACVICQQPWAGTRVT